MQSKYINHAAYAFVHSISTVFLAVSLMLVGLSETQAAWFIILLTLNFFSLPLVLVEPAPLPLWVWYIVVLLWVLRLAAHSKINRDCE